jgi:AcrR family transcriptional regulator
MLTKTTRIPGRNKSTKKAVVSPRKQPTQSRAQVTVQAILEASAHILETRGLAGFNTNAIAEKAGVSIGSLYQYFPGKDSITVALIQQFEVELVESIAAAMRESRDKPLSTALSLIIDAQLAVHCRRVALHRILESEELRLIPNSDAGIRSAPGTRLLADLLRRYQAEIRHKHLTLAAIDCMVIVRAMTDSALEQS